MCCEEEKKIISIFNWVRNLPFEAGSSTGDYCRDLEYIKTCGRGSCSSKHYLLGSFYEKLGIPVTYLTYSFYWKNLTVAYPDSIKALADRMPIQYHLALRISINGQSFLLDATWDLPLEKGGFPVNRIENKLRNTRNAVVFYGGCMVHQSALQRNEYIKRLIAEMISTGVEYEFYVVLNQWLENLRKV